MRNLRSSADRELVEGPERLLRVLPLPTSVSRREREQDQVEGLFAEELGLLQPTPGYMRLVKDRVLYVWQQRTSEAKDRATEVQRRAKAVQQKLDRLDEAFLYAQTIDLTSYERQRDNCARN